MNVPTLFSLVVSIFCSGGLALLAVLLRQRRSTPGSQWLAWTALAASVWTLAGGLETAFPAGWLASEVAFLAFCACLVCLLRFSVEFTQNDPGLTRRRKVALGCLAGLAAGLSLTNYWHGLLWNRSDAHPGLVYWTAVAVFYGLYLVSILLLVRSAVHYPRLYRRPMRLILMVLCLPWIALLLHVSGLFSPASGDLVPLSFAAVVLALTWGMYRLRLFDLEPAARERVIEWMNDCLIVLDSRNRIIDLNPAVRTVLLAIHPGSAPKDGSKSEYTFPNLIGRPVDSVFQSWPELVSRLHLGSEGTIVLPVSQSFAPEEPALGKTYELRVLALVDQGGRNTGKIVILHDITGLNRANAEIARARDLTDALRVTGPALNTLPEIRQALDVMLEQINRVLPADCATIHVLEGSDLVVYSVRGFRHPEILAGTRRPLLEGWPGEQVLQQHCPVILNNLQDYPNLLLRSFAGDIQSCLVVPILYRNQLSGLLTLYSSQQGHFLSENIPAAEMFAAQMAIGLENNRLLRQMDDISSIDALTGLFNRRHFFSHAETEFARTQRTGKPFTVFLLDLDHFKQINEVYGHHTGDLVLAELGQICSRSVRAVDLIGRFGGEEFAFVLPETDPDVGLAVARRLHHRLTDALITTQEGASLQIAVSIGVAAPLYPADTLDTILDRADQALRLAKRSGGNQVRAYERISAG